MTDLLIRGMEIPKNCSVCPMLEGDADDGLCHAANRWLDDDECWIWCVYLDGEIDDGKPLNCPLVEVPTPHGRLIDADALIDDLEYDVELNVRVLDDLDFAGPDRDTLEFDACCKQNCIEFIREAPVVIEPEAD